MIADIFRALLYTPLLNLLTFFNWATPGHYAAVSILIVTLIVRFALLIPSRKAAETQRKMMQLAPLINELKKEYGDDKQGLAIAQMELYKKNDISPVTSSCLPTIIQLVVLIVFYNVIRNGLNADAAGIYSWLPRPEHVNSTLLGIDLLKPDPFYIFPVLAAVLQYVNMKMVLPPAKPKGDTEEVDPMVAAQRNMLYILPAMTLFFSGQFPAGIAFYWVITTAFNIGQQYFVNKKKFEIAGVEKALDTADKKHPEHAPRSKRVEREIAEETKTGKGGVSVTVRRKK